MLTSKDNIDASILTIPNLYSLLPTFNSILSSAEKVPKLPSGVKDFLGVYVGNNSDTFKVSYDVNLHVVA